MQRKKSSGTRPWISVTPALSILERFYRKTVIWVIISFTLIYILRLKHPTLSRMIMYMVIAKHEREIVRDLSNRFICRWPWVTCSDGYTQEICQSRELRKDSTQRHHLHNLLNAGRHAGTSFTETDGPFKVVWGHIMCSCFTTSCIVSMKMQDINQSVNQSINQS